ncbi:hypothetical protein RND71_034307 [Anisodus tanguticus]|uniref:Transmembrane protein n=1 Tax=Anisodus tanguticus TaxID=243964 RepID=A0AAE1RAG4_9SOLA|nr:hypothetical protein RND71_034307 [Anisodus tanguticus]
MKDDDALRVSTPTTHSSVITTSTLSRKESSDVLFRRGRYKFWALSAILLLAFWSMLTGTVSLRWSAGNLNRLSDDFDTSLPEDLDVLVRCFEAAYEELTSDDPEVREDAISEIAKMSVRSIDINTTTLQSSVRSLFRM